MTRVINLVHIMCSAIIKPSGLIIQNSKNHLCLVIQTLWSSLVTGMKRWDLRERGHPSTHDASMENYHPAGKVSEMEGKEAALLQNWGGGGWGGRWKGRLGRSPPEVTSSVGDEGGLFFPKEQWVTFVVTSAVKLTPVPVKIIYKGCKTMVWFAAATATMYGRCFLVFFSFHSNRQKMTKMTTSGLTDRTTKLLSSFWTWLHYPLLTLTSKVNMN